MDVWSDCTDSELLAAEKMDFVEMKDGTENKLLAGEEMLCGNISNKSTDENKLLKENIMDSDEISDEDLITMCEPYDDIDDQKTLSELMEYLE